MLRSLRRHYLSLANMSSLCRCRLPFVLTSGDLIYETDKPSIVGDPSVWLSCSDNMVTWEYFMPEINSVETKEECYSSEGSGQAKQCRRLSGQHQACAVLCFLALLFFLQGVFACQFVTVAFLARTNTRCILYGLTLLTSNPSCSVHFSFSSHVLLELAFLINVPDYLLISGMVGMP